MRLTWPNIFSRRRVTAGPVQDKPLNHKAWLPRAILVVIAGAILVFAGWFIEHKRNNTINKYVPAANAVDANINSLKSSKDINDRRVLVSDYVASGNYDKAEELARSVAADTKDTKDYITLITVCANHPVSDKQQCLDDGVTQVKPKLNELSFFETYVIASMLDDAKDGKNALIFYQRAYQIYDSTKADQYTMTKDQIGQRIKALNG